MTDPILITRVLLAAVLALIASLVLSSGSASQPDSDAVLTSPQTQQVAQPTGVAPGAVEATPVPTAPSSAPPATAPPTSTPTATATPPTSAPPTSIPPTATTPDPLPTAPQMVQPSATPTPQPSDAPAQPAAGLNELAPATPTGPTVEVAAGGSIEAAVNAANPGDTVLIAGGTYPGPLTIGKDGTEGAYITLQAKPGEKVIIDGGGAQGEGALSLNGRSYIRLVGISVQNSGGFGVHGVDASNIVFQQSEVAGSQDGGLVFSGGTNITVENSDVHGNNAEGTSADSEAASFENVNGFEIANSRVFDNGEEGIDAKYGARNGVIRNNEVHGNRGPNIYVDAASDIQILDNQVWGVTEPSKAGIGLAVESQYTDITEMSNVTVKGNTIRDNEGAGIFFWSESGGGNFTGITVENNKFSGNAGGSFSFASGSFSGQNVIRNNTFGGGDSPPEPPSGVTAEGNTTGEIDAAAPAPAARS